MVLGLSQNANVTGDVTGDVILEPEDYNWGVLFLTPVVLFGITGNVFVCMAISMEKRLQTVTNYFLLSLAITDLLVCIIVMPISIVNDFFGYWRFTTTVCNLFITADVLMCTSSILHLCSISVQRYLAISRPLKWRNKSKSTVAIKIALIWVAAIVISSPVSILGVLDRDNILNSGKCTLKNYGFIIYGSILAFFIPLVIMVITYALTVRLLYNQSKLCDPNRNSDEKEGRPIIRRSKTRKGKQGYSYKGQTRQNGDHTAIEMFKTEKFNNNSQSDYKYRNVPSIISHSISCENISTSRSGGKHVSRANESKSCFLSVPRPHAFESSLESLSTSDVDSDISDGDSKSLTKSFGALTAESPDKISLRTVILYKASSFLNLARERRSDKTTVRTEQKASKVLGLVFAIFLLCWLPFFIINIFPVICKNCSVNPVLSSTFVWLGWASSTLNPIIYTMFNKTFKRSFVGFLCCRYNCRKGNSNEAHPSLKDNKLLHRSNSMLQRHSMSERELSV